MPYALSDYDKRNIDTIPYQRKLSPISANYPLSAQTTPYHRKPLPAGMYYPLLIVFISPPCVLAV